MEQMQVCCQNRQLLKKNGFSKHSVNSSNSLLFSPASIPSTLISLIHRNVAHDLVLTNEMREGVDQGILGSCNCFAPSNQGEPEKGMRCLAICQPATKGQFLRSCEIRDFINNCYFPALV